TARARDVAERAVAIVAIENLVAVIGDEEIDVAVVVVVAGADALSPSRAADACLVRHVGERAVAVVAIQMTSRRSVAAGRREPISVDEKDVGAAVVVVIDE